MSKVLYTVIEIFYLYVACGGGGCVMHDVCLGPLRNTVYVSMSR
jgi:hypothetical protein